MTETENLVLEHLRAIRGDVAELKEGQARLERRLSTVEHHLAALVSAAAYDASSARQAGNPSGPASLGWRSYEPLCLAFAPISIAFAGASSIA